MKRPRKGHIIRFVTRDGIKAERIDPRQFYRFPGASRSLGLTYALCLLGGGAAVIVLGWHLVRWLFR